MTKTFIALLAAVALPGAVIAQTTTGSAPSTSDATGAGTPMSGGQATDSSASTTTTPTDTPGSTTTTQAPDSSTTTAAPTDTPAATGTTTGKHKKKPR